MNNPEELTGLSRPEIEHGTAEDRPMAMYWMTDELLDETVQVWSGIYGRTISRSEAIEILRNVTNLYKLIRTELE